MTNYSPKFTIGCDPEVFVTKRGKPFSAYNILEGTKESPHKTIGGAYQVDGMAAEFNTDPVALRTYRGYETKEFHHWNNLITSQIKQIRDNLPKGCSLKISPTMNFGKEFLDKPMDIPFIPSWNRVQSAMPDVFERLYQAVEDDYQEFSSKK